MFTLRIDAMRTRLALMAAGALVFLMYMAAGRHLGGGHTGSILIEYGAYPREFEGCEVEIDGGVAGRLKGFGAMTRAGFQVKEGRHRVRVLRPGYASIARTVEVASGHPVLLVLDLQESLSAQGQQPAAICFSN